MGHDDGLIEQIWTIYFSPQVSGRFFSARSHLENASNPHILSDHP